MPELDARRCHAAASLLLTVLMLVVLAVPLWLFVVGLVATFGIIALGIDNGGVETLPMVFGFLIRPDRAVRALIADAEPRGVDVAASARRSDNSLAISAILAGGDAATVLAGGSGADLQFRRHRLGRADGEGRAGWWIDVPVDAGLVQLRVQATPLVPVQLHVAVDGAWIESAGPAPQTLVHRAQLPAGQAWVLASIAQPDGSTPIIELWIEPAPGIHAQVAPAA